MFSFNGTYAIKITFLEVDPLTISFLGQFKHHIAVTPFCIDVFLDVLCRAVFVWVVMELPIHISICKVLTAGFGNRFNSSNIQGNLELFQY